MCGDNTNWDLTEIDEFVANSTNHGGGCEPQSNPEDAKGNCPDCGAIVDADGVAVAGCGYSPEMCKTCHWSPCDWSC